MSLDYVSSRSHGFMFKENPGSDEGYLSLHYWPGKPNGSQNNRDSSLLLFVSKNQKNQDPIAEEPHGLDMGYRVIKLELSRKLYSWLTSILSSRSAVQLLEGRANISLPHCGFCSLSVCHTGCDHWCNTDLLTAFRLDLRSWGCKTGQNGAWEGHGPWWRAHCFTE